MILKILLVFSINRCGEGHDKQWLQSYSFPPSVFISFFPIGEEIVEWEVQIHLGHFVGGPSSLCQAPEDNLTFVSLNCFVSCLVMALECWQVAPLSGPLQYLGFDFKRWLLLCRALLYWCNLNSRSFYNKQPNASIPSSNLYIRCNGWLVWSKLWLCVLIARFRTSWCLFTSQSSWMGASRMKLAIEDGKRLSNRCANPRAGIGLTCQLSV